MYLGIEIGGTKIQLGVGTAEGPPLVTLERFSVDPQRGAEGIREQLLAFGKKLRAIYPLAGVGIGFGGPVNTLTGHTTTSYQVAGWDNFPLAEWVESSLELPAVLLNDCDAAALGEARFGAGVGLQRALYITVGTGVGGGLVVDGTVYGAVRPAAIEIGHLRGPNYPGTQLAPSVQDQASGRGIEEFVREWLENPAAIHGSPPQGSSDGVSVTPDDLGELRTLCAGDVTRISAKQIAEVAASGNGLACRALERAVEGLAWGICQAVTLLAPEVVIIGGGVSLMDESLFWSPLQKAIARQVFPPLANSFNVVPARLGEQVVVFGALAAAANR